MKKTGFQLLGLVAFAAVVAVGCTVTATPGGPVVNTEYENCVIGDGCTGGTTCEATEFQSGLGSGSMCTASCVSSADCPLDSNGATVDCVINAGSGNGQCYIDCNVTSAACENGTSCRSLDGFNVCVP